MKWLQDLKVFIITGLVGVAVMLPVYQSEKNILAESGLVEQASLEESPVSDQEILEAISDKSNFDQKSFTEENSDYSMTLSAYENLEKKFETYENKTTLVSTDVPLVDYEDIKSCSTKQLAIENLIKNNKTVADLTSERSAKNESLLLPRRCVTHVMNDFNLGPEAFARCPNGPQSEPTRGGTKPCVTKNLANMTYNSFVDIAECLNINPKNLLPKLANESGLIINTLGGGFDAGVGQMTRIAITEVNNHYKSYFDEMNKATISKPACLRVMKYKSLLVKVSDNISQRCGLIVPPENPIKNFLYMAILTRRNMDVISGIKYVAGNDYINNNGSLTLVKNNVEDELTGRFKEENIREKLNQLGLVNVNLHDFVSMISIAAYNSGLRTSFNIFRDYLNKRIAAKKPLTWKDFDFHTPELATDIYTNEEKTVTGIARSYIKAPLISETDTSEEKKIKIKRIKGLAKKIKESHLLTFPEYITYNQNNFFESRINPDNIAKNKSLKTNATAELKKYPAYQIIGAPGYLNFLASKDTAFRQVFGSSSYGPDYCSNPKFLMRDKNQ